VVTRGIFAIWWDPLFDHGEDAEPLFETLEYIRDDCLYNLGMADPPNPAAGYFYNVYIHHGDQDLFPNGWALGQGTDPYGLPFLTVPHGSLPSHSIYHEGFHIFQYKANSPGFAYSGDSQWYIESCAQWYMAGYFPDAENLYVEAGAIIGNPQLALWHSFGNQAPDDPASDEGRPGWMYGVRQYGMHTYLRFLTEVMGVERSILTDGFYASTDLSPQEYIYTLVGSDTMRSHFADWAAHNSAGLDYLTPEQVQRALLEIDLAGDWDYFRPSVWQSVDKGTEGEWFRPPADLTARGWAYNVFNITNTLTTSYTFEFDADANGSQGAESFYVGRVVRMTKQGAVYSDMTMTDGIHGMTTVPVTPEHTEVLFVVASVPEFFGSYQHYSYQVKIGREGEQA